MAGTKFDTGKPPITLVRPEFLWKVGEAMGFGARKYGRYNYREGMAYSRLIDALLRHAILYAAGEDIDPDSGLPHLALIGSNANMLYDLQTSGLGEDDRIKKIIS